ncbi:hypothetical protein J6590_074266 [Homalodisca vitripennis]|nr:hypothetical protein J6590_074266 [Homalodisca vitripennis]
MFGEHFQNIWFQQDGAPPHYGIDAASLNDLRYKGGSCSTSGQSKKSVSSLSRPYSMEVKLIVLSGSAITNLATVQESLYQVPLFLKRQDAVD